MKNNQLFNGTLIFFLFIISALFFSKIVNRQKAYNLNAKDLIQNIHEDEVLLNFINIKYFEQNELGHNIIDLRNPNDFEKSHLPNATNTPLELMFEKKHLKDLKKIKKPILVYSENESESVLAALLLRSAGIANVYAFPGNFEMIEYLLIKKSLNPAYYYYNEDKSKWDFNKYFSSKKSLQQTIPNFSMPQQIEIKQQAKGGC